MADCFVEVKPFACPARAMSTAHFYCVICGAPISRGAQSACPLAECPSCKHMVPAPDPVDFSEGEMLRAFPPGVLALDVVFACDGCGCRMKIDARAEGKVVPCPKCARESTVPYWSRRPPVAISLTAAEIEFLSEAEFSAPHGRS